MEYIQERLDPNSVLYKLNQATIITPMAVVNDFVDFFSVPSTLYKRSNPPQRSSKPVLIHRHPIQKLHNKKATMTLERYFMPLGQQKLLLNLRKNNSGFLYTALMTFTLGFLSSNTPCWVFIACYSNSLESLQ
jgi:hypothetical protein